MNVHVICRCIWNVIKPFFNKAIPDSKQRKKCWAWIDSDGKYGEWHGPNEFFWGGNACCKWDAKFKGVLSYIKKKHPELYKQFNKDKEVINE